MALTGGLILSSTDIYTNDDVQMHPLGACGQDKHGDLYRYAKLASNDVSAGYLVTSLAAEANHQNIAVAVATAVGDTAIELTPGATAVDANEYDWGYLVFNDVSPEGEWYRITSHDAANASTQFTVNVERPFLTATTTSSEATLVRNPWQKPAVSQLVTERAAGVTVVDVDVSARPYTWLKTRGVASVLTDTAGVTVGYFATISDQVNGALGVISDIDQEGRIAQALSTGTATEFNAYYLTID